MEHVGVIVQKLTDAEVERLCCRHDITMQEVSEEDVVKVESNSESHLEALYIKPEIADAELEAITVKDELIDLNQEPQASSGPSFNTFALKREVDDVAPEACSGRAEARDNLRASSGVEAAPPDRLASRPLLCEHCDYSTGKKDLMNLHLRVSHKLRFNYECELRDYSTIDINTLQRVECDHGCNMEGVLFPNSYEFVHVQPKRKREENSMCIEIAIKSRIEFKDWLSELSQKNNVSWTMQRGDRRRNGKLELYFVCHHAMRGQKGVKTTNTNCPARLKAVISTDGSTPHPCRVIFTGRHNHSRSSAAFLSELRMSASTKEEFRSYFEQGMLGSQALRHHQLKLNFQSDIEMLADRRLNPTLNSVVSLRARWMAQNHRNSGDMSVLDAMQQTKKKRPQHLINFAETPGGYVAVLVTEFMYRIHKEVQSASEVVFVETTSSVHKTNCSLTLLVCPSAAGGLPLGVILSSTQTKEDYVRGFSLLREMLSGVAFNGKLHPEFFITGDSDAERGALREVWPQSKLFLCVFHVLQSAWRWLWYAKNAIANEDRKPLISVLKKLVYAESICSFEHIWSEFLDSELSQNNFKCTEYFRSAVERREEWGLPWRCGSLLHGHNTNNMCESMMIVIKDIVLNRNKVHNGAQLLLVMADVYDNYHRLRLSDVILKKDRSSKTASSTIPLSAVTHNGGAVYTVNSALHDGIECTVDLSIGTCSCTSGYTGSVCKHQLAASQYSAVRLPQLDTCAAAEKQRLYKVMCGDTAVPTSTSSDGLLAETPADAVLHVHKQLAACDKGDKSAYTEQVVETSTQTLNNFQSVDKRINKFTNICHQLKPNFQSDVEMLADRRLNPTLNPTLNSVVSMREKLMAQNHRNFDEMSILDATQQTENKMPQHLINFAETPGGYVAVLVTEFMYRIHKEMQSASEVVFVETTSRVDKTNCSLTLLVCSSAAGGLPLGVILSSTQTKEDYVRGFSLLRDMLSDVAFGGKLHPECFITDDSDAERGALHEVWPQSKLFLCVFHVLQSAWRWLWYARNAIAKEHRKPLILVLKKLAYAESICSFEHLWSEFLDSELSRNNFKCTEYFRSAVERREEWGLPWRCGSLLRGHNTNNMCESMMTVIKDIVLNRNEVNNGAQLLLVMADVYDNYHRLRLSDVILKKDRSSQTASSTIPLSAVTHNGGAVFTVNSALQGGNECTVDLSIGTCSCTSGYTGSVCKHQLAASQYSATRLPQLDTCTATEKQRLYKVMYGDPSVPTSTSSDDLLAETPTDAVSLVNEQIAACDQGDGSADQVMETSTLTLNDFQSVDDRIDEFTSMLNKELKRTKSTSMLGALDLFEQRVKACGNPAQVSAFLRTAGCALSKESGAFREKNPTSIARRHSGKLRGKAALLKGKIVKRNRNSSINMSSNVPNSSTQ